MTGTTVQCVNCRRLWVNWLRHYCCMWQSQRRGRGQRHLAVRWRWCWLWCWCWTWSWSRSWWRGRRNVCLWALPWSATTLTARIIAATHLRVVWGMQHSVGAEGGGRGCGVGLRSTDVPEINLTQPQKRNLLWPTAPRSHYLFLFSSVSCALVCVCGILDNSCVHVRPLRARIESRSLAAH